MANIIPTNLKGVNINMYESNFYEGYGNVQYCFDGSTTGTYILIYTKYTMKIESSIPFKIKYFVVPYSYNGISSANAESYITDMQGNKVITFDKGLGWHESEIVLNPGNYKWVGTPYLAISEIVFGEGHKGFISVNDKIFSFNENNIITGDKNNLQSNPLFMYLESYPFTDNKPFIDYILSSENSNDYKIILTMPT